MVRLELIFFGAAASPLVLAFLSVLAGRGWRRLSRYRSERETRTALVRQLGFHSVGRRSLGGHLWGLPARVSFGVSDEVGWGTDRTDEASAMAPWRRSPADPDEMGAPSRRATATIEVRCQAAVPCDELLVEIAPPLVLRGRSDQAFSLLHFPLRDSLFEGERVQWVAGLLRVTICRPRGPESIVSLVERIVRLARDLEEEDTVKFVERRLVDEALFGKHLEDRLRAIRLLIDYHDTPLPRSALVRLADDPIPVVRLTAARALGRDGLPRLRALAEDSQIPPTVRVGAIEAMCGFNTESVTRLLTRLLTDADPGVAALAVRRLAARGEAVREDIIKALVLPAAQERTVLAGIDYLERVPFVEAFSTLDRLSSHRSERVQCAAIDVIGRRADPSWLPNLNRRLNRRGNSMGLKMSLQTAVALIRSRHDVGAGQLSLTSSTTSVPLGALSPPAASGLALSPGPEE